MDDTLEDLLNDLTTAKVEADDLLKSWNNANRSASITPEELSALSHDVMESRDTYEQLKEKAIQFLDTDPDAKRIVQIVQLMNFLNIH